MDGGRWVVGRPHGPTSEPGEIGHGRGTIWLNFPQSPTPAPALVRPYWRLTLLPPSRFRAINGLLGLALFYQASAPAQEPDPKAGDESNVEAKASSTGIEFRDRRDVGYKGRAIADVMSYFGADWLFRPEREAEERPEAMLDALGIEPGMTVADVGAGAGYQSLRLARRVGAEGTVLATDVQPQMLRMLAANAKKAGFKNIKPILCTQSDPKLPEGTVDLILLVDVYHEVSDPEAMLQAWRKALKPGGRIVFVEFRAEDPTVPIKPEHKMSVEQVRKEVEPQGFDFDELHDFLPWQHILIFRKSTGPEAESDPPAPDPNGPPRNPR